MIGCRAGQRGKVDQTNQKPVSPYMSANQMPEQSAAADQVRGDNIGPASAFAGQDDVGGDAVREQDRLLPIANVARIMKMAIPTNAKIAKDAKETVQECVSELISFVTSEYTCL